LTDTAPPGVPEPARERIGIFGGTFDPVHVAHLVAAVNVRHELGLDRVLMIVANDPWQKSGSHAVTPPAARLSMVEAAVEGVAGLEASGLEIERGGVTYTADSVAELRSRHPDAELFLIVGADVADELASWQRVEELRAEVTLVVVTRPGTVLSAGALDGWRARTVVIPQLEISSTDLRERAGTGRPLDYLVPAATIRRIRDLALYAVDR
jgi:nicotinate-nucleotide adenylyltransferase